MKAEKIIPLPTPALGSRWVGEGKREARVLAVEEGYVMVRYVYALPFCLSLKDFYKRFAAKP